MDENEIKARLDELQRLLSELECEPSTHVTPKDRDRVWTDLIKLIKRDRKVTLFALARLLNRSDSELRNEPFVDRRNVAYSFEAIIHKFDISFVISEILKIPDGVPKYNYNYHCQILMSFAIQKKKNAETVLNEINKSEVDKSNEYFKRLIKKCEEISKRSKYLADLKSIISESYCRDLSDDHSERVAHLNLIIKLAKKDKESTLLGLVSLLSQTDKELHSEPRIDRSDIVTAFKFIIPETDVSSIVPNLIELFNNGNCMAEIRNILQSFAIRNKQNSKLILNEIEKSGINKNIPEISFLIKILKGDSKK